MKSYEPGLSHLEYLVVQQNGKSGTHNTYSTDLSQVSSSQYLSPGQIRETEHPQLISDTLRR